MERIFHALGDRNRLRIVLILSRGPLSVGEIASVLGLSQSNASHHLKQLTEAGIVRRRGERGWAFYGINPDESIVSGLMKTITDNHEALSCSGADLRKLSALYRERRNRSREFFGALGEQWDLVRESLPSFDVYRDALAGILGTPGTLLEIGVGAGHMIPFLAELSKKVVGVDNSPEMLDAAAAAAREKGLAPRVDLRLGEAEHLPMGDASVDAVIMHFMLHHVGNPGEVLLEASRVIRAKGRLVLVEFTGHSSDSFRQRHGDLWPGFSPEEILVWCRDAGLTRKETKVFKENSMMILSFQKGE
jgi:DNA-binding transcriptional ArsR family regulator/protein-L-isoaspartate O-methyltransferase